MFNPFSWLTAKAEEAVDRGIAKSLLKYVPAGESPPPALAELYQMIESGSAAPALGDKPADGERAPRTRKA